MSHVDSGCLYLVRLLELMLMRLLLASAARALASRVFPGQGTAGFNCILTFPYDVASPSPPAPSPVLPLLLLLLLLLLPPLPGGPNSRRPLAGALSPVNRSGLTMHCARIPQ